MQQKQLEIHCGKRALQAGDLGNRSWSKPQRREGAHKQQLFVHLDRCIVPLQDLYHPVEANRCLLLGVAQPVLK